MPASLDPSHYTARPGDTFEEIDLDQAEIHLDGKRFTEADAERESDQLAQDAPRAGRPSLHGGRGKSPQVAFRVPEDLRAKGERVAELEGHGKLSVVAREAFEAYVNARIA